MFSRPSLASLAAVVASAASANANFAETAFTQPDAPTAIATREPQKTLDHAIQVAATEVVTCNATHLPLTPRTAESTAEVQKILNRWGQYVKAVGAYNKSEPGNEGLSKPQAELLHWVKAELQALKIDLPFAAAADQRDAALRSEVDVLSWGLRALLAKNGAMVYELRSQSVLDDRNEPGTYHFVIGLPNRVYSIDSINQPEWRAKFPSIISQGVELVSISRLGGAPYTKDASGAVTGIASLTTHGSAFLNLEVIKLSVDAWDAPFRESMKSIGVLDGLSLERTVELLQTDGAKIIPEIGQHIDELKTGGVALRRLLYQIGTAGGKEKFALTRLEEGRRDEFAYHEAQHVLDSRVDPKSSSEEAITFNLEQIRSGAITAAVEDQQEAEALVEVRVRLESMKHSSVYVLQLIGEARANFPYGNSLHDVGAQRAQRRIFTTLVEELAANGSQYGVVVSDKPRAISGVVFSPTEQTMAQLDLAIATPSRREALADAVARRMDLQGARATLVKKHFPNSEVKPK